MNEWVELEARNIREIIAEKDNYIQFLRQENAFLKLENEGLKPCKRD